MKKLSLVIIFLISFISTYAQHSGYSAAGGASNGLYSRGDLTADSSIMPPIFPDTPGVTNTRVRRIGNIIREYSTGDTLVWEYTGTKWTSSGIGNVNLQTVLDNGNTADTGIHLIDYSNSDPISGTSKNSSFVSRLTKTDADSVAATMQLNDKWVFNSTSLMPVYGIQSTPIFSIADSANSGIRYQGFVSNINLDSATSKGYFRSAWMMSSGGHFGYPGSRVQHYAGVVVHNPVIWDTCDACYGIKIGGFNATNFINSIALAIGFISKKPTGNWSIYTSQHIGYNNYFGSGRTLLGLPNSDEIDSNASLQTETITTTGLIKSTTNISGTLTDLSYPQKVYVDSLTGLYLLANGITTNTDGLMTFPNNVNGGIKAVGTLYEQTKDTQSTSGGTVRVGLSSYYTNTSGNRSIHQLFGTFAPTSGTGTFSGYSSNVTINQTGGASGITSSYLASASITAAADYRAFRATNTSGVAFYNESGNARNIFLGEVQIGSITDLGAYPLQVTGAANITGNLLMSAGSGVAINQAFAGATNNFEGATSFTTGITTGNIFQNSTSKTNRFRGITTMDTTIELKYVPVYTTGGFVSLVRNTTTDSVESITLSDVSPTDITVTGGLTITSPYTFRKVDATAGAVVLTVTPSYVGQIFTIKKVDAVNTVTVQMASGNIDGGASHPLSIINESVTIIWDGVNGWISQ